MTRPFIPESGLLIDLLGISNVIEILGDRHTENPWWKERVLKNTSSLITEFQEAYDYLATPPERFMIEPSRVPMIQKFSPTFREQLPDRLSQTQTTITQLQAGQDNEEQKIETQEFFIDLFEHLSSQLSDRF